MQLRLHPVLAALPLTAVLALKTMGEPIRPEDIWWHLGMGRLIAAHRAIPTVDLFSFTREGAPFFDQPWLAQLLLFFGYRATGLAGLLAFDFALMLGAEALAIATAVKRGARVGPALLVQFALAPLAARGWPMRPQALVVPIFAAYVYLLTRFRAGARSPVWLLVPLMVAWANLHGSFPLGVLLILLTLAARAVDSGPTRSAVAWSALGLAAPACALAALVNPRGPALFTYVASLIQNPSTQVAREWQPVSLTDVEGVYIALVLVMMAVIAVWKRPPLGDIVLLVPFVVFDLYAVRNGIWLSMVAGPFAASWLTLGVAAPAREAPASRLSLAAGAVAILLLFALPWVKPHLLPGAYGPLVWEQRTPVAAVEALSQEKRRPARLFHGTGPGSYLIWALPSQPVFIDPRMELYPVEQWNDLFMLEGGRNIDIILARYYFDGLLIDKYREAPLVLALRGRPDFLVRFEDADCAYFARR